MMLNLHFYSYDKRNGSKKLNSRFILLNVTFFTKSRKKLLRVHKTYFTLSISRTV